VDDLTSALINDSDSDLNEFSKTPLEAFWNFASILILIHFCRAWHVWQTFKYVLKELLSQMVQHFTFSRQ